MAAYFSGYPSDLDDLVADALYSALPLAPGSSGPAVAELQQRLAALGHDIGPDGADGSFGTRTAQALVRFQTDDALEPTGILDDWTLWWLQFRELCFSCGRD